MVYMFFLCVYFLDPGAAWVNMEQKFMHIDIRNDEVVQILERMTCPDCESLDGCETYQSETKRVLQCRYCEYSEEVLR